MESRTFTSTNGLELIINSRKSAVIFEMEQMNTQQLKVQYNFEFKFAPEVFNELLQYIETISNKSWVGLSPKDADSLGSDYYEYYDRKLDNNGYLTIIQNGLSIERPSLESGRLYQFNKKKMESFIYDFKKDNRLHEKHG